MSSRGTQVQLGSKRPANTVKKAGGSVEGIGRIFERMSVQEFDALMAGEVTAEELLIRHNMKDVTEETSFEDFSGGV